MTNQRSADFRASLRDQLTLAGPPSIAMLAGRAPLDHLILLSALQAAGLLDETTAGTPELRRLRRELRAAAESSGVFVDAVRALQPDAQVQDLLALGTDDQADQGDREEALHQMVALAGLAEAGPPGVRDLIDPALSQLEAHAITAPEHFTSLADLSEWMADQLDLDDEHRATRLLRHISETPLLASIEVDESATRNTIAALAAAMGGSTLHEWAKKLWNYARPLAEKLEYADSELRTAGTLNRAGVFPKRIVLYQDPEDEVSLCLHGGQMFLEWGGPPEHCPRRAVLSPDGTELQREEETFVGGTALWVFSSPPPGDVTGLVLHREGDVIQVSFADE